MNIRYAIIEMMICLCFVFCTGCQTTEKIHVEFTTEEWSTQYATEENDSAERAVICVDVCGEVLSPGVYVLAEGSRVCDAIEAAGGLTADAARESVNMARIIADGEQIIVIAKTQAGITDSKVNINTATIEELCALPGLGEEKAEAIISYRKSHGYFRTIEDLMKVTGIKEGLFQKIKDKIRV